MGTDRRSLHRDIEVHADKNKIGAEKEETDARQYCCGKNRESGDDIRNTYPQSERD
jgi:hypothetical protein